MVLKSEFSAYRSILWWRPVVMGYNKALNCWTGSTVGRAMRAFQILTVSAVCAGVIAAKSEIVLARSPAPSTAAQAVPAWKEQVVAILNRHKRYPATAVSRREQGVTQIFFSIDRRGRVLESRVLDSTGVDVLDEEALALIRRAEPFPQPPRVLAGDHIEFRVPIKFSLPDTATTAVGVGKPEEATATDGLRKREHTRYSPSGESRTVWFVHGANPDCSPWGPIEIKMTKKPEQGTVEIVPAKGFPNFTTDNIRFKCNALKAAGFNVNYKSSKGYTGADDFTIFVIWPNGYADEVLYKMDVR
jgi:TonB family protein